MGIWCLIWCLSKFLKSRFSTLTPVCARHRVRFPSIFGQMLLSGISANRELYHIFSADALRRHFRFQWNEQQCIEHWKLEFVVECLPIAEKKDKEFLARTM